MLGRQQIQAVFDVCRDFSIGRDTTSTPQSTTPICGVGRKAQSGRCRDQGRFMEVQKATFSRCLRPQNCDFTCVNLVEALK
jgi:hypothetical protein